MTVDETESATDEEEARDETTEEREADEETVGDPAESERTTIRAGRNFEAEYRLSAADAGEFLVQLGEELQDGDELTLETDEWELPFAFGDPATLEVDYEGVDEPELEIELELPGRSDDDAPDVN